ncbi:MAG: aldo/keto reductase [Spirochaetaceae bacterium]|jgi:L-glyceraldehyde 3-phosphate reductase|nr:aldo/keto reductase [Spirochaetaceae bacterium]
MTYTANKNRYESMKYRRTGRSGLLLPEISLGFWHNFGGGDSRESGRATVLAAFDAGITHFDFANNYGPPPGAAERSFGVIFRENLLAHRDEIVIATKAGYEMWEGPYGNGGSKKYLVASLDASLKRLGIDYADIFYHHRPDPDTPLEETMDALAGVVRAGKALYAGISNYPAALSAKAIALLRARGVPCLIHQAKYSMLDRWTERGLLDVLETEGVGCICFSPLAQGLLTGKYLDGAVPSGSRASRGDTLNAAQLTPRLLETLNALNRIAREGGRTLSALAIQWILRDKRNTSVLLGASSAAQLAENLSALSHPPLSEAELERIEDALSGTAPRA